MQQDCTPPTFKQSLTTAEPPYFTEITTPYFTEVATEQHNTAIHDTGIKILYRSLEQQGMTKKAC